MVKTVTRPVIHNLTGDEKAVTGIIVPDGGQLFVVKTRVDPAWQWDAMLKEACPDYQSRDVQRVADLYPPQPGEPKDCYVYGLNFGHDIPDTQPAVGWAKQQDNLHDAGPRHIYSVARDVPDLNKKVGVSYMGLISTVPVKFEGERRVCDADFGDAGREAFVFWFGQGSGTTALGSPSSASCPWPDRCGSLLWTLRPFDFCSPQASSEPVSQDRLLFCMLRLKTDSRLISRQPRLAGAEF